MSEDAGILKNDEDASGKKVTQEAQVEKRGRRRTRNYSRSKEVATTRGEMGSVDDSINMGAAMLLSMIDEESYERAMLDDSESIMQNHLLPKSLPWARPRVELLRTLPRDIEDIQGVWYAGGDGEDELPRTNINSGRFGYGMFDMGGLRKEDVKGTRADTIISARTSPQAISRATSRSPPDMRRQRSKKRSKEEHSDGDEELDYDEDKYDIVQAYQSDQFEAAARRSSDKGVIELNVKLPLPSLEWSLLMYQYQNVLTQDPSLKHGEESVKRAKTIMQAERAEKCSSMPLYWDKIDRNKFKEPPAFFDISDDDIDASVNVLSSFHQRMKIREKRKRKISSLTKDCSRSWKISVKVGGVSSRASISRPETKPMYCNAMFPTYVQSGQTLTLESAKLKDEKEGLRDYLGSYDCRATSTNREKSFDAMDDEENFNRKDGRSKRINVGRTRIIWSKANVGGSKVGITSLFNGQKLDAASYKRPKELKVTIRLNGKIISVVEHEEISCPSSGGTPKQKRTSGNLFTEKFKWSAGKVNEAINIICKDASSNPNTRTVTSTLSSPTLSEEEEEEDLELDTTNAFCMIDTDGYVRNMAKDLKIVDGKQLFNKKGKVTKSQDEKISNLVKHDSSILQQEPPKFVCVPLCDGYFRNECESPGSMLGSSIGKMLNQAAKAKTGGADTPVCTICWTGSENYQILECGDCGLLAHQDCCLGAGEFNTNYATTNNDWVWKCAMCKEASSPSSKSNRTRLVSDGPSIALSASTTAPASAMAPSNGNGSRKSQRTPRLPHRFQNDSGAALVTPVATKNIPIKINDKCTLCPHSGGAMSMVSDGSFRWTHDVCRVWALKPKEGATDNNIEGPPSSPPTLIPGTSPLAEEEEAPVCCLCGMGLIHNKGRENQEILEECVDEEGVGRVPGLVKCAAAGCNITFHPMCALLATKVGGGHSLPLPPKQKPEKYKDQNAAMERDVELCQQYSLKLAEISRLEGSSGNNPGQKKTYTVPIAFCGFHNPDRDPSFYGCTPCADQLSKAMNIPYQINLKQHE